MDMLTPVCVLHNGPGNGHLEYLFHDDIAGMSSFASSVKRTMLV